jgi:hypothetical protein
MNQNGVLDGGFECHLGAFFQRQFEEVGRWLGNGLPSRLISVA